MDFILKKGQLRQNISYSVLYAVMSGTVKIHRDLFICFTLLFIVRTSNLSDSKFKKDRKGSFFQLHDYSFNTAMGFKWSENLL